MSILVTGGTGSFGHKFTDVMLREYLPKKLIIFSRDELKQHEMRQLYPDTEYPSVRYFIGDVRDRERLRASIADLQLDLGDNLRTDQQANRTRFA